MKGAHVFFSLAVRQQKEDSTLEGHFDVMLVKVVRFPMQSSRKSPEKFNLLFCSSR